MESIELLKKENGDLRWEKRQHLYNVAGLYLAAVILANDPSLKDVSFMPLISGGFFVASIVKAKDYLKTKISNDKQIRENKAKIKTLSKE